MLAPCCHPKIEWARFCNTRHLEACGIEERDFGILQQILHLSKYRKWWLSKSTKSPDARPAPNPRPALCGAHSLMLQVIAGSLYRCGKRT